VCWEYIEMGFPQNTLSYGFSCRVRSVHNVIKSALYVRVRTLAWLVHLSSQLIFPAVCYADRSSRSHDISCFMKYHESLSCKMKPATARPRLVNFLSLIGFLEHRKQAKI
jgi:hypothetical protein